MECTASRLDACIYEDLSRNTRVINKSTLEHFTWVKIPSEFARDNELFNIEEILPNNGEVEYFDFVDREPHRPWIRIKTQMLNTSIGKHIYKLSFVHRHTDDITSLYVSYTIQDDNPEKPYIYMNRNGEA